jgi:hypothetical protein
MSNSLDPSWGGRVMGVSISYLWYLSEKGLLNRNSRVLDIGTSYLYNLTVDDVTKFSDRYGSPMSPQNARELAELSIPRPGQQMLFLSDLLDLTDIAYVSYDVCPGKSH